MNQQNTFKAYGEKARNRYYLYAIPTAFIGMAIMSCYTLISKGHLPDVKTTLLGFAILSAMSLLSMYSTVSVTLTITDEGIRFSKVGLVGWSDIKNIDFMDCKHKFCGSDERCIRITYMKKIGIAPAKPQVFTVLGEPDEVREIEALLSAHKVA